MMTAGFFMISASLYGAIPSSTAKELTPSSKWWLNYADNSCVIIRNFGEGDDLIAMRLTRSAPGSGVSMTLAGNALKSSEAILDLPLAFEDGTPGTQPPMVVANTGKAAETPLLALSTVRLDNAHGSGYPKDSDPPDVTPEREAAVSSLIFRAPDRNWYRLKTGSMKSIMAALRTCTDKVVESWGYSPAEQRALSRPATPTENPRRWLGSFDYPQSMLNSGSMAIVESRLDIDETGQVAGCHINSATLPQKASDTTCKLLSKRAKFLPALDASGKAVKSYYLNTVRWVIRR